MLKIQVVEQKSCDVDRKRKEELTYALSGGSTGSSAAGLSTRSSLSFLTGGASKSLNSSGALEKTAGGSVETFLIERDKILWNVSLSRS